MTRWGVRALGVLALAVSAPLLAADPVDAFIQTQLESEKLPGVALLVMQNGEIVKQKGYGYANLEHHVPVTADTIFQSGSTGKQFTAAGILLLAQDGKLDLDDRLASYYREAPAAWHRITIRHLLTHTSGIKDYADEFDYLYRRRNVGSDAEAAARIRAGHAVELLEQRLPDSRTSDHKAREQALERFSG